MSEFHDDFPSYETLAHHSEEEGKTKRPLTTIRRPRRTLRVVSNGESVVRVATLVEERKRHLRNAKAGSSMGCKADGALHATCSWSGACRR